MASPDRQMNMQHMHQVQQVQQQQQGMHTHTHMITLVPQFHPPSTQAQAHYQAV